MLNRIVFASIACLMAGIHSRDAQADLVSKVRFNIAPQQLSSALLQYSKQSGVQISSPGSLIEGKSSTGVVGTFPARDGLDRLLQGTDLAYDVIDANTILIRTVNSTVGQSESRMPQTSGVGNDLEHREVQSSLRLARSQNAQGGGSRAQDANVLNAQEESAGAKLEEIIVTATKRAQNVQDIPMSLTVIGNQEIERRGLIGMEDYLRSIPGVNQIDNGPYSNAIVMRGISTSPQFENFSSGTTVASYFDETPITAAAGQGAGGIDVRPVDIERIEVLRGPQGTAYGSSSLGGLTRIIPAKPKLDGFSARLGAFYSDTSGYGSGNSMVQGVFNIPVVKDRFALRVVGYRYEDSGFYRNIAGVDPASIAVAENYGLGNYVRGSIQNDIGNMVSIGGRLAALWQPTERLNLSLNYLTQKIEQDGSPVADVGKFDQTRVPIAPQGRVRGESGEINDADMDLANAVLTYDLGWATSTSVASRVDGSSVWTYADYAQPYSTTGPSDFKSFTAETRLASRLDGRFQFLAGLFYEDIDDDFRQTLDWPGTPATNPGRTDPMSLYISNRRLEQRAAFGEVSYKLTGKLTATLGGRYFDYDKSEAVFAEGGLRGIPLGTGVWQVLTTDEGGSSFKANLSYQPTERSLLYASWSEGFRLGRPTPGVPTATCDPNGDGLIDGTNITVESTRHVASDFLENYEIGGKFTFFDRRMTVDTAIYHIDWDGLPIRYGINVGTCLAGYTANVGAATSDGVEFQASVFVTRGLRIDFGGGYTKARLSKDAPALFPPAFDGDRLPGSPEVNANLAAQYDFKVAGYDTFVRADTLYTGKFYGDLQESLATRAGDYVKIDARAGVAIKSLSLELFVRNLTNEDAFTWRSLSATRGDFYGYRLRPRTIGLQLGYSFE